MRRISKQYKTLRGFTLVEMLLVIAIIVILAGTVALGVSDFLDPAKKAQSNVKASALAQSKSISDREFSLCKMGF